MEGTLNYFETETKYVDPVKRLASNLLLEFTMTLLLSQGRDKSGKLDAFEGLERRVMDEINAFLKQRDETRS